ncbi:hypothetical protein [Treponema primitia]|uniref:hypothetical protein n=1 Tax=Treponema primitia TaxID=88058 RepID=UPI00145C9190|nr:hypothetical protein [Treponema primitia]
MKVIESNRNHVLSNMHDRKVFCHKGCNLCCHSLSLTVDTLSSYILSKVFEAIPYNELFPFYKKCIDKRIKARAYIDSLPVDTNRNDTLEEYATFGFTVFTCPFVDEQNGCLIYTFSPQICFSYFSSVQCKISYNPVIDENQKLLYEQLGSKAETIDFSGLDNDSKEFHFDDTTFKTYDKFDNLSKTIKQDPNLEYFLSHSMKLEILTIISMALEKTHPGKYKSDMQGIEVDLLAIIDGEMKSL